MIKKYHKAINDTRVIDLVNQTFGKWTVIKLLGRYHKHTWWECKCECGLIKPVTSSQLRQKSSNGCKNCKAIPLKYLMSRFKNNAKKRKIKFEITLNYITQLYNQQDSKCALTDLPLSWRYGEVGNRPTASLDRIDSNKGYEIGNVQWVHKDINIMKMSLSQDKFIEYCKLVIAKL